MREVRVTNRMVKDAIDSLNIKSAPGPDGIPGKVYTQNKNFWIPIIRKELQKVMLWFETQSVIPTVKSLRESFQETVDVELEKTLAKLGSLTEKQQAEIEKMVRILTNKLLHKPSTRLKHLSGREDLHLYLETLSELFDLNPSNNVEEASPQPALKLLKKQ